MINSFSHEQKRFKIIIFILLVILVLVFFISMLVGRYHISAKNVLYFFIGHEIPNIDYNVILKLRMPRTIVALLIGGSLSLSGAIYQSAFNNKLVSPDILGVSSGASVGACFGILLGLSSALIGLLSFIMGFVAVALSVIIAYIFKNKSNVVLILAGLAVGGLMSSGVGLMKYLADNEMKLAEMTYWLLGDISGSTFKDVYVLLPVVVMGCLASILLSWRLNIISLGKKEAKTLGVNYNLTMIMLIAIATALTALSVSISGTIGWIGLVIPNIVRLIVGSNNKKVIPVSMLVGAIFMMLVDMLARSLAPNEIPLSVITGILGTPIFIIAIYQKRKELK